MGFQTGGPDLGTGVKTAEESFDFLNFGVASGRELCYPIPHKEVGERGSLMEMMEWGAARILALRKHAGMTQSRFAQWLGVSIKQVKYLEHQRRNPSGPSRRLLDILAGQCRFNGTEGVTVLGAGASHLRPSSDKPDSQTASVHPRDTARPLDNPAPKLEENKAPAKERDSAVAVSPEVADDAFVWR